MPETREHLMRGLMALRDADADMAREKNALGFSRAHADTGRWLIEAGTWSDRQARIAWQVCVHYKRTQLAHLPWDEMQAPEATSERDGGRSKKPPHWSVKAYKGREALRVAFPYDKSLRIALGACKALWAKEESTGFEESVWYVPLEPVALEGLLAIFGEWPSTGIEDIEGEVQALCAKYAALVAGARAMEAPPLDIPGLAGTLRPFQAAGVLYASEHKRVLIADEMGTGKTLQALSTCAYTNAWPLLVICPASLKLNWAREVLTWFPGRKPVVLSGGPGKLKAAHILRIGGRQHTIHTGLDEDADVVIINFDVLKAWSGELLAKAWGMVVIDESHYIKEPGAQRTQYASLLASGWHHGTRQYIHGGVPRRLLMSGTPMPAKPKELISQLQCLGRLGEVGGMKLFLERYCDPKLVPGGHVDYGGASNLAELQRKIGLFTLRRLKRDVMSELPEKSRVVIPVELDNALEYEKEAKGIVSTLRPMLNGLGPLFEEAEREDWDKEGYEGAEALVRLARLKRLVARGKVRHAKDWIANFIGAKKLVVFAWHRETALEIAEAFDAPVIIGGMSPGERDSAVARFQEDDAVRLIVLGIRAGGVGITLHAASDVLFLELGWTPGEMDQAEDRVHRLGQRRACVAWYMLGAGTIEEEIYDLIESKRKTVDTVIDGRSVIAKALGRFVIRAGK